MRAAVLLCALTLLSGCAAGAPPLGAGQAGAPLDIAPSGVATETSVPAMADRDCEGGRFSSLRPPAAVPDPASVPRVAKIRAAGRLRVGLSQSSLLLSHLDPRTGRLSGFEVEIATRIGAEVFGPDFAAERDMEFSTVDTAQRLTALKDQQIDMVIATLTMTCERRLDHDIDFSTEYLRPRQGVLVRSGGPSIASADDLKGAEVCAGRGTTSLVRVAQLGAVAVSARDTSDCMLLLQQGEVDAVSTDDVVLAGFQVQDPTTRLLDFRLGEGDSGAEPYGVAMDESDTGLIRFVNAVLAEMRADGTWKAYYDKHLAATLRSPTPPTPPTPVYRD
ncbi:transporter substrate-binding domain-containing protein [Actinokineospora sp. 24-640]